MVRPARFRALRSLATYPRPRSPQDLASEKLCKTLCKTLCFHGRPGSGDGVEAPVLSVGEVETALVRCTRYLVDGFLSLPPHDEIQNPLAKVFHYSARDGRVIHFDSVTGEIVIVPPCHFAQVSPQDEIGMRTL